MSDGIAEMHKEQTQICTRCTSTFNSNYDCMCGQNSLDSPLATASAELAAKGTPLVADKPVSDIDTEQVTDPAHYAKSYPDGIEVYQMIEVILEKLGGHLTPYDQWLFGNILKYRLRAGFKDDGNDGMQDLKKAMRCREMMTD